MEGDLAGRIVLGDLEGNVAWAAGDPAPVDPPQANLRRTLSLDPGADEVVLPLHVAVELIEIGEDVFGTSVDLNAVRDQCLSLASAALSRPAR